MSLESRGESENRHRNNKICEKCDNKSIYWTVKQSKQSNVKRMKAIAIYSLSDVNK